MALSSKALQQKRAKKAAKRKQSKKTAAPAKTAMATEWLTAPNAPIADVFVPEGLFEVGLGSVWFSRKVAEDRYALAVFLLDTYCLGVKSTMSAVLDAAKYQRYLDQFLVESEEKFVPVTPEHAYKLVEMAADYAAQLGFTPHTDYKLAKMIFGDLDPAASDAVFHFGKDGHPLYVPGPGETPTEQRRIMKQLEKLHQDPYALLARGFEE